MRVGPARSLILALAAVLLASTSSPVAARPPSGPMPTVTGPVSGGLFGRPVPYPTEDLAAAGYVIEEFFLEGTARSYGASVGSAAYKTRILVIRPRDKKTFNGTVVADWMNVSGQGDGSAAWFYSAEHFLRDGYTYVGVSAQKVGVEGPSPIATKFADPVRYGSLVHPGDDFAFDIYTQAGRALLEVPRVLGGLNPKRLVAAGESQSAGLLKTYINDVHESVRIYDGFVLLVTGSTNQVKEVPAVPVLHLSGEAESAGGSQPDRHNYRLWEMAGASHAGYYFLTHGGAMQAAARLGPENSGYDEDDAEQYGERGGGPCPANYFPDRYAVNAAFHQMDVWIRDGVPAPSAPRIAAADAAGAVLRDADGNAIGGLRLPPIDVPVAAYNGARCALAGETIPFLPTRLAELYPTHAVYVQKMQAASDAAVAKGFLLPADAADMMARAKASSIGN